jgi:hypothetical protein
LVGVFEIPFWHVCSFRNHYLVVSIEPTFKAITNKSNKFLLKFLAKNIKKLKEAKKNPEVNDRVTHKSPIFISEIA